MFRLCSSPPYYHSKTLAVFFFHRHKISRNKSCNVNVIGKLDKVTTRAVVTTSSIFRLWPTSECFQDTVHQSIQELLGTKRNQGLERWVTSAQAEIGAVGKMFTTQTSKNSTEDWPATVICYFSAPSATGSPISSNHVFMFFSQISWSSKSQTHNTKHNATTKVWFSINRGTSSPCCFSWIYHNFFSNKIPRC